MSAGNPARPFDKIANQWRDLATRRLAYYVELFDSGRWKHYFDEQQFVDRLREVVASTKKWNALAGHPSAETRSRSPT